MIGFGKMTERFYLTFTGVGAIDHAIKIEMDTTSVCQKHRHEFVEIVYFYKGIGRHVIDDEEYSVKSGDVFILSQGARHEFVGDGLCAINMIFDAEKLYDNVKNDNFIRDFYKWAFGAEGKFKNKNYLYVSDFAYGKGEILIFDILQEYNLKSMGYESVLKNSITTIIINIFRKYQADSTGKEREPIYRNMIEQVMTYVEENIKFINKTSDVTDKIGYNPVYFSRVFLQYVGMTIAQYIRQKKVEYACRLLSNTNYTVEKICEDVGYNDLKNFYKIFKMVTNVTPCEYRNGGNKNFKRLNKNGQE